MNLWVQNNLAFNISEYLISKFRQLYDSFVYHKSSFKATNNSWDDFKTLRRDFEKYGIFLVSWQ